MRAADYDDVDGFTMISKRIIDYCAQECSWQSSGELSVAWMYDAYLYAHRFRNQPIKARDILALGRLVEPHKNSAGLRECKVWVGGEEKLNWKQIPEALDKLIAEQPKIGCSEQEASDFFYRYEMIHPFVDGNGRSGSLIHNWLLGTLKIPVHPPNLWQEARRSYEGYPAPDTHVLTSTNMSEAWLAIIGEEL